MDLTNLPEYCKDCDKREWFVPETIFGRKPFHLCNEWDLPCDQACILCQRQWMLKEYGELID